MTEVKVVSDKGELEQELKNAGDKLVMVDFFATWCMPCVRIAPTLKVWQAEKDMIILKVDVDESDDLTAEYNVEALPTFKFFRNGVQLDKSFTGGDDKKLLETIEGLMQGSNKEAEKCTEQNE